MLAARRVLAVAPLPLLPLGALRQLCTEQVRSKQAAEAPAAAQKGKDLEAADRELNAAKAKLEVPREAGWGQDLQGASVE